MDKRWCNEKVLRKIIAEYEEKRTKTKKAEMAFALVGLLPSLMEESGMFWFKDGADKFSASVISDENTMFCMMDLMPVVENGDYYVKYIGAGILLSSLCTNQVRFWFKSDDDDEEEYDTVDKKWESQTQNQNNQNKKKA